jgi:hypothetical protein
VGGDCARLASSWTCLKAVRNLIVAGATTAPATGGKPWKHNDRHATMNGQALLEGELLVGWHGISSAIPAIEDVCADRPIPFIAEA